MVQILTYDDGDDVYPSDDGANKYIFIFVDAGIYLPGGGADISPSDDGDDVHPCDGGVCATYLWLDTSTKCLKLFYTSPQPFLG